MKEHVFSLISQFYTIHKQQLFKIKPYKINKQETNEVDFNKKDNT